MNLSDSERVRTVLNGMGFVQTDNENEATILGIIACSVRQKGIDKVYGRIEKWNAMKNRQNVITFVSGCILPAARLRFQALRLGLRHERTAQPARDDPPIRHRHASFAALRRRD